MKCCLSILLSICVSMSLMSSGMSLLISLLALSAPSWAQSSKVNSQVSLTDDNVRKAAMNETNPSGAKASRASETQVTGMLKLQDPRPEIVNRSWVYFAGFSAQSFQANGRGQNSSGASFNLSENSSTLMPGVELGFLSAPYRQETWGLQGGLRLRASFASQSSPQVLRSGYRVDDARLNSTLWSGGILLRLTSAYAARWSFTVSPQYGVASYTQSSSNDYVDFSQSFAFDSMGYGVDYAFTKTWSLFTEWTQRNARNPGSLALQSDNLELGAKVQW